MSQWNCCRTCLSSQSLQPIYSTSENSINFPDTILSAVGIKISSNDNLPQEMCLPCINFINEVNKFCKKAEECQRELQNRLKSKQFNKIKNEASVLKFEQEVTISLQEINDNQDDFKDYDDNLTLDNFKCENNIKKLNNNNKCREFETTVQEIVDKPLEIFFKSNNKKSVSKEKITNRKRTKKENTEEPKKKTIEKGERVKEQVECEHCHKILTSKLSLRNHKKIHTGFDVVCEHCGKKFITRRLLLMHCRAKHGYEKTDKCSYCDYKASNAEQVKIHERLHTGERPYVCAECGAGFHRKSSYLQHIAIHLPEKTVPCDICSATFKSVTLMRIHKSRHRAPQHSFRCGVCGNNFARRRNVARHLQRIHGLSPEQRHIDRVNIG